MNVLVTAGGTLEKIDDVRAITNYSTGRLGSLVAEKLAEKSKVNVTYICSSKALVPSIPNIEVIQVETVDDLLKAMEKSLETKKYDAVVHSMAVSDYYLEGTLSNIDLSRKLAHQIVEKENIPIEQQDWENLFQEMLSSSFEIPSVDTTKKISSSMKELYLQLKATPKVIKRIKELQPDTLLIGFKLLVGETEAELVTVGNNLMKKNDCDYVLANDKNKIHGDHHEGYLIDKKGNYAKFITKQEIAKGIAQVILSEKGK